MCLNSFHPEENLINHKTYCSKHKRVKTEMLKPKENILQFEHYNHSLKVPFVTYADFECMLQKIQTCQPSDETSYTNPFQKHNPNNFAYYIKYCKGDFKPPVEYSGMDAANVFYKKIKDDVLYIAKEYYEKIIPMNPLAESEMKTHKNCHICEKPFDDLSRKAADHDHLMGQFRGAAHGDCNLNYKNP
jgi:glucose-6-phosphate 1-dehydrogenase